ncbi:hypothetical protein Tco_1275760 [Tanacetum coccineum]
MTKASTASSFTRNPPQKRARTNVIDISSSESSPLRRPSTNYIVTPTTPLESPPTSPVATPIITPLLALQPNTPTIVTPREVMFTTPLTSPHPYLNTLEDLPPTCTNPPPLPTLEEIFSLPLTDHMDVEPFFPLTNLTKRNTRLSAFLKPNPTLAQIIEELNEIQDISNTIDMAIQNAQNLTIATTSQTLPLLSLPSHLSPPQTFITLDQSLWIDEPSFQQQQHEHTCAHCLHTQHLIHEV